LTEEQERALLRGLAPKAENRWHSAGELYAALCGRTMEGGPWSWSEEPIGRTEFVDAEESKAPIPDPAPRKPEIPAKWIKFGGAAACTLVVVAIALAIGLGGREQESISTNEPDRSQSTVGQTVDQEDSSQTPEEEPDASEEDGQTDDGQL